MLAAQLAPAQFTFEANGSALAVDGYSGPGGAVAIPGTNNGQLVTSIASSAFESQTYFTSVTIPNTITNIGEEAFLECDGITNVIIPSSVISIGEDAFTDCSALTRVTIPGSVTSIGFDAFAGCVSLSALNIQSGVPSIGQDAFYYCTSLSSVTLPASVTNLADDAFSFCTSLQSIFFLGYPPAADSSVFSTDPDVVACYVADTNYWGAEIAGIPALYWNPIIQTGNGNFGERTSQFGFDITGTAGIPVVVEARTNSLASGWQPLQTNILTNGDYYFSEAFQTNLPGRFYRLSAP